MFSSISSSSRLTTNGIALAWFNTVTSCASTSISPVGILVLNWSAGRIRTGPVTCITHSFFAASMALAAPGNLSGFVTIWVIPKRSRNTRKTTPPKVRKLCTQPASVTVCSGVVGAQFTASMSFIHNRLLFKCRCELLFSGGEAISSWVGGCLVAPSGLLAMAYALYKTNRPPRLRWAMGRSRDILILASFAQRLEAGYHYRYHCWRSG